MTQRRAETSIEIQAPIATVWKVMMDLSAYHEWNPFIVRADGVLDAPAVGQFMLLKVRWADGSETSSKEIFARIEPPSALGGQGATRTEALLEYAFRGPLHTLNLVRGSRVQRLSQMEGGATVYRTEERFLGLLKSAVPLANVQDGFERHARALKARAESNRS